MLVVLVQEQRVQVVVLPAVLETLELLYCRRVLHWDLLVYFENGSVVLASVVQLVVLRLRLQS